LDITATENLQTKRDFETHVHHRIAPGAASLRPKSQRLIEKRVPAGGVALATQTENESGFAIALKGVLLREPGEAESDWDRARC
jgi:hypothetical protein